MILERIAGPEDLRALSDADLERLAREIRSLIVDTVSRTGGHLGASLGAVELVLAVHSVFSSPQDKIIWDVGHQAYAHKIITGRRDVFHTLRQLGGLSGFPKRRESPHDHFETGHSSTSISAALGMAVARDLLGQKHCVVAVIGDGSMTGGMAYEALNNAGHLKTDLLVILNDNSMSISRNVGAMAEYLARIRTAPVYSKVKSDVKGVLKKVPFAGKTLHDWAERLKGSVKYLLVPGTIFEEMGFTYLGPIDGHNISTMKAVFDRARSMSGPVLVHVVTRKGKGYPPAERNPDIYHGPGPFDPSTGAMKLALDAVTYSEVFGDELLRIAREDGRVVAITAAMGDGTGLARFRQELPSRFFDVGIAEQHAVTFAAGLAASGMKPVVAIYSTFLQRAYDQISHDVCRQNLPVVFALDRAGIVGEDGDTHHGLFDIAYLRHIPNISVLAPSSAEELKLMLRWALSQDRPVAIRYPRGIARADLERGIRRLVPSGDDAIAPGKGRVVRYGSEVVMLALGSMVEVALGAAEMLELRGIHPLVYDARFAKPLDEETILGLTERAGLVVTLEEGTIEGGFGSAVLECIEERARERAARRRHQPVEVVRLGVPPVFVDHGSRSTLLSHVGLSSEAVAQTVADRLERFRKDGQRTGAGLG